MRASPQTDKTFLSFRHENGVTPIPPLVWGATGGGTISDEHIPENFDTGGNEGSDDDGISQDALTVVVNR